MALINAIIISPSATDLPNSNFAALNKVVGTNKVYYTLDYDQTTEERAEWTFPVGDVAPGTVTFDVWWTATAGTGTVKWNITQDGVANDEVFDAAGTQVNGTDTLIAAGDAHLISITGTASEFGANEIMTIKIARDVATDTLTADARLLGIIIRLET